MENEVKQQMASY